MSREQAEHDQQRFSDGEQEAGGTRGRPRISLARLAAIFLRIGATGFGGMMPLLALVHHYVRERYNLVDEAEFAEAVAVGQLLPGPIVVDATTHIGYRVRGGLGALVTTVCILLPPTVLVIILSPLYFAHEGSKYLSGALRGIEAAVVGLIVVAVWRIARPSIKGWLTAAIAVGSFLALALTRVHPVLVVILAGVAGMIGLRPRNTAGAAKRQEGEGK